LSGMIDAAGFEILYGPSSTWQKLSKSNFSLCLRKRP